MSFISRKTIFFLWAIILSVVPVSAFVAFPKPFAQKLRLRPSQMSAETTDDSAEHEDFESVLDNTHACWQDMYDDDCGMGTIYAASFVAKDWIKSMPCGKGVEDCNMPESLKLPGSHENAGVETTDVMDMLGLKRARPL